MLISTMSANAICSRATAFCAEFLLEMARVDQRHDGIEREVRLQVLLEEESLRHRSRVGQARGLYQDRVEAVTALAQLFQDPDQVPAHGAADAAVAGLEDLFVRANHQFVIDTDLAEFVFDDGDALAMLLRQDAIHQRGLAGAEESGQHRYRHASRHARPRSRSSSRSAPGIRSSASSAVQPRRRRQARAAAAPRRRRHATHPGAAAGCVLPDRAAAPSIAAGIGARPRRPAAARIPTG